ncbi:MAG: chorismate synthase [Candidatus Omnitrophica bacterium]|nr:chorismate synthase [Candidatus Omnitrophota bacterium]
MLRYMTAGESHGKVLLAILDGMPAGLRLDTALIDANLSRRMSGYGRGKRMQIEKDTVEVLSGTRKGITIGSPIALSVKNKDNSIESMHEVTCPRPGHADLAGVLKYGFISARDVLERASARETAARVAAGSVARIFLAEFGIDVFSHVIQMGPVKAFLDGMSHLDIKKKALRSDTGCADKKASELMKEEVDKCASSGDTLGGVFETVITGVPAGLGSYVQWDKRLDGILARSVMAIPAVKAVSIGIGVEGASRRGSKLHDTISYDAYAKKYLRGSNNAGGIEGGVTNGEPVIISGYMKPIATLMRPLLSADMNTKKTAKASVERSDTAAVLASGVVSEAVVSIEIASAFMEKFGCDSMKDIMTNFREFTLKPSKSNKRI